ncbi:MAG: threonine--tRNA ligase [Desulfurococcales archaeon]|nr:threonine--tRNA ligase [Desulfurococcales archaeon]
MREAIIDQDLQAYAGLLASSLVAKKYGFKPLGCSASDRGLACDFDSGGIYPSINELQNLLGVMDGGDSVSCVIKRDEYLQSLGRPKVCVYREIEIPLEGELNPRPVQKVFMHVINVSAHNPEPNVRLLRVNMVAFDSREKLEEYLKWLEEAEKRDHRILGRKLDLFSFHEEAGAGLVLYHPKGQIIREELIKLAREINDSLGYKEVYTPHVYRSLLWRISGHLSHYKDKMILANIEGDEYGVKPMNCPGHILIYKSLPRSYRDLPLKLSEFGTVYRWEKRGELYGLLRVRGFTQDDGHAFLREDQVKDEVKAILEKLLWMLSLFGFKGDDIKVSLSTRPEEYIGTIEAWDKATEALELALEELGLKYEVKEGEGAFYGPKVDVDFRDSLGRWWQCGTIQVDFNLPERFNIVYTDENGQERRPVMVHRALLGSVERFMAIIIENFSGRLPTWLSPVQVAIIPVNRKLENKAMEIAKMFRVKGIRVEVFPGSSSLGKRVREAYNQAIPYIVVIGKKEAEAGMITVRARGNREAKMVNPEKFLELLLKETKDRKLSQLAIESLLDLQ